jgi:hypothetical protein
MKRFALLLAPFVMGGCLESGGINEPASQENDLAAVVEGRADWSRSETNEKNVDLCSELVNLPNGNVEFRVLAKNYTAAPWDYPGGSVPANQLDAFGIDWFHDSTWQPLEVIWADTWGSEWNDGGGDYMNWLHDHMVYPNQYVRHHGGRSGAMHVPGDWYWSDHFAEDEYALIFSVIFVPGAGAPPRLANRGRWHPSADFENYTFCPVTSTVD